MMSSIDVRQTGGRHAVTLKAMSPRAVLRLQQMDDCGAATSPSQHYPHCLLRLTLPLWVVMLVVVGCSANDSAPKAGASSSPSSLSSTPGDSATGEGNIEGSFRVDGRDLYLSCTGEGKPTLVLEGGEGATSSALEPIRAAYDADHRVCAYDRANVGMSGTAPTPRAADSLVEDLHGLLEAAEVPGPYLLVGTSAGGMLVQAHAAAYPKDVAGVVALNPVPPWGGWSTQGFQKMTPAERAGEAEYFAGSNAESLDYRDISAMIERQPVDAGIPFHLLISTVDQCESRTDVCGRSYPDYEAIMLRLSQQWPGGRMTQVDAPHEIFTTDMPAVRKAIDDVLERTDS